MPVTDMSDKNRLHYAWVICFACSLLIFCTSGLAVNAFSVYQPFIISENNFSNTQSSVIITVRNLFSLVSMLCVELYYKKLGMRNGMALAGALVSFSFLTFGLAHTYTAYLFSSALIGTGYGLGTMIPVSVLIKRWFNEKQSTALGICSAVTGLSTLGIPTVIQSSVERFSLSRTFITEGVFCLVLTAVFWLLIRNSPEEKRLKPLGNKKSEAGTSGLCGKLQKSDIMLIVPMLLLIGAVMNVSYSHITVLMTGEGFSERVSALAISVSGISLMTGKICYGKLGDKIGLEKSNFVFAPVFVTGTLLCCFISKGYAVLFIAMVVYSFGMAYMSVGLSSWPLLFSDGADYGKTVKYFQIGYASGCLIFSSFPGIIADRFEGSYVPSFFIFTVLSAIVFVLLELVILRSKKGRSSV